MAPGNRQPWDSDKYGGVQERQRKLCSSSVCWRRTFACLNADLKEITRLLQDGHSVHIPDGEGRTPLAVVAAVGSAEAVEIAKMLLDWNAEPNSSDKARGAVIV